MTISLLMVQHWCADGGFGNKPHPRGCREGWRNW